MSETGKIVIAGSSLCAKCNHPFYRHLEDSTTWPEVGTSLSELECSESACGCMGYMVKTPTLSKEQIDPVVREYSKVTLIPDEGGATESSKPFEGRIVLPIYGQAEAVKHPAHYNSGKIEVWDFIIDQGLTYCLGDAVKYITRAGKKDPKTTVQDLEKSKQYIDREIKRIKEEMGEKILEENRKAIDAEHRGDPGCSC